MPAGIFRVLLLVPIFLFSLSVHEFAHAWVAMRRGDPTPRLAGRVSLHPLAHADLLGTLVLPILCIFSGWPFFGWAKPVPIDVRALRGGRRDMALVAAAGPVSNLILAVIATGALALLIRVPGPARLWETVELFAVVSIQVNLMLAAFNLIPIPPLDGFNVLQGALPSGLARRLSRGARWASALLLLLFFSGGLRFLALPVEAVYRSLLSLAGAP